MTTPYEDRVLGMVRAGTICEAEARQLMDSLKQRRGGWRMLFNPFDRISTSTLWLLAIVVTAAGIVVSRMGVRFDGSMDLHLAGGAPRWSAILVDVVSAIFVTAIVFWVASLLVSRQGRIIDFVLSVAVARFPNILVGALLPWIFPPTQELIAQATGGVVNPRVVFAWIGILLPGIVWFITLLCTAFRTSSGLKGLRLAITFTAALIAAEIVSKTLLLLIGV